MKLDHVLLKSEKGVDGYEALQLGFDDKTRNIPQKRL
jgi:hypothetical protein